MLPNPDHQTLHFFSGFMGEPSGQLQSAANSGMLDSGPLVRKLDGACASVRIWERVKNILEKVLKCFN